MFTIAGGILLAIFLLATLEYWIVPIFYLLKFLIIATCAIVAFLLFFATIAMVAGA